MPILRQTLRVNRQIKCPECHKYIFKLKKSIPAGTEIKQDDLIPLSNTTNKNKFYCPHCDSPWMSIVTGRLYSR